MLNLPVKYEYGVVGFVFVMFMAMGVWGQDGKEVGSEVESWEGRSGVSVNADRILRSMGAYLGGIKDFEFRTDVSYDVLVSGDQMVQYGGHAEIAVSKPGRMHAFFEGDERRTRSYINGGVFTVHDLNHGVYSMTEVPELLDDAVDEIVERYGFNIPVADLLYADPYAVMIENVVSGFVVGLSEVDGVRCHHLAFVQESIDWQVWIEVGPHPLPRKVVITYKESAGAPQYVGRLSEWDLAPALGAHSFELIVPAGADEIELLAVNNEEAE